MLEKMMGPFKNAEELLETIRKIKATGKPLYIYDVNKKKYVYTEAEEPLSWRGNYRMPFIEIKEGERPTNIDKLIKVLSSIDGAVVEGYKGGAFVLSSKDLPRFEYDYNGYNIIPLFIVEAEDKFIMLIGYLNCESGFAHGRKLSWGVV